MQRTIHLSLNYRIFRCIRRPADKTTLKSEQMLMTLDNIKFAFLFLLYKTVLVCLEGVVFKDVILYTVIYTAFIFIAWIYGSQISPYIWPSVIEHSLRSFFLRIFAWWNVISISYLYGGKIKTALNRNYADIFVISNTLNSNADGFDFLFVL